MRQGRFEGLDRVNELKYQLPGVDVFLSPKLIPTKGLRQN